MSVASRFPWLVALTMGGVVVAVALGGLYMWKLADDHRAAAEGTGGTPGVFVAHDSRGQGPMSSRPGCYGTFRPDGGGQVHRDVGAYGVPESGCVRGRTYRARFARDRAVLPGADDWKGERWGAVVLTVFVPVGAVLGSLAVLARWKRRKAAGAPHER